MLRRTPRGITWAVMGPLIAAPVATLAQTPPQAMSTPAVSTPSIAATPRTADSYSLPVLKGLAPVATLLKTYEGRAALGANYAVTGGLQTGALRQSTLLPFAAQQQQALRDAFITDGNIAELADGLGTTLGAAYQARAHYVDRSTFTSISPAVADLIAYTNAVTGTDSNAGKYFFANGTTEGRTAVSEAALSILKASGGVTDIFGRAYGRPAGSPGADLFGDSRPFQTEPNVAAILGADYFGVPADNASYNKGPISNLTDSPSFPSGHTTYGYMGSLLLAMLVPERYPEMIARGAEYGNDRILMGAHYAMDVLGGRTLATYDLAHLLANDSDYMGRAYKGAPALKDFRAAVQAARGDLRTQLEAACGQPVGACAREDIGRFGDPAATAAFYATTQTFGLPTVFQAAAMARPDVAKLAPEAGYLLTVAFPSLTLDQADAILTETLGPGGGFLDDGSAFGLYSRLDLYSAGRRAAAMVEAPAP